MSTRRRTKPESAARLRDASKHGAATTVAEYITRVPESERTTLKKLRALIRSALPRDVTEVISYRIPAFKRDGVLIWYAAFRDHCSLFPGGSVLGRLERDIVGYKASRGTIQFPLDRPLPAALIEKIVKARLAEREGKGSRNQR